MTPEAQDARFRAAVGAIDAGDVATLQQLLTRDPGLATERLERPGAWLRDAIGQAADGFFREPYLLWFVAEDPVRNGKLPANIVEIAGVIIHAARTTGAASLQEQLDYALRLVAWSWIASECGVQLALIDALVDAGARPEGEANNALVNGHRAAARRILERGGTPTLATALCLDEWALADTLAATSTPAQKQFALVLSALNGRPEAVRRVLAMGASLDAPSEALYSHGRPVHHAVCSGSLETVQALVEAGARLDIRDTAFGGTPLGWAEHYLGERGSGPRGAGYAAIAAYIRERGGLD